MVNKDLVKFIKEARKRGFQDFEIRTPLLKKGWPIDEVEKAFENVRNVESSGSKMRISINLDREILKVIEKRAKKNLFSVEEQIEDIVRRSSVNTKVKKIGGEKIDDLLVGIFSRKKTKK